MVRRRSRSSAAVRRRCHAVRHSPRLLVMARSSPQRSGAPTLRRPAARLLGRPRPLQGLDKCLVDRCERLSSVCGAGLVDCPLDLREVGCHDRQCFVVLAGVRGHGVSRTGQGVEVKPAVDHQLRKLGSSTSGWADLQHSGYGSWLVDDPVFPIPRGSPQDLTRFWHGPIGSGGYEVAPPSPWLSPPARGDRRLARHHSA